MLFFAVIYLGGSVLGSAEIRMFSVIAPVILLWIAYIIQKSVYINLDFNKRT
jgi:energy-converting hydrogenase Eha subunit H